MKTYLLCVVFKRDGNITSTKTFKYMRDDDGTVYLPYELHMLEDKYYDSLFWWEAYENPSKLERNQNNGFIYTEVKPERFIGCKSILLE